MLINNNPIIKEDGKEPVIQTPQGTKMRVDTEDLLKKIEELEERVVALEKFLVIK